MTHTSTRRLRRNLTARAVEFVERPASAAALLDSLDSRTRTVYLTGEPPAQGWLTWALDGLSPTDGTVSPWEPTGHYLDGAAPVLRYMHADRRRVEIHRASIWFGAGHYGPVEALRAWSALDAVISRHFPQSTLLATPATTGRELFLRTIPYGREWPTLPTDLQDLIRATDGQGRTELVAGSATFGGERHPYNAMPALYEYDGRLMYAALCWGLPMGVPVHDSVDRFEGKTRARYHVDVTVPHDWPETFGLLGCQRDDGSRLWRYPHNPGETFTAWCDGAELELALEYRWPCTIRERLVWPDHQGAGKGPLDTWAAKLVAAREQCEPLPATDTSDELANENRVRALTANAIRAILLHGIGAFHGRPHLETHYQAAGIAIPDGAEQVRLEGNWIVYALRGRPPGEGSWRAQMSHPEWAAAVWARARRRLLAGPQRTGALHRTAGDVVAFRTDAVYLTRRQDWPDDERVGRLRLKRACELGPYPWPTRTAELLALRDTGRVIA